MHAVRAALDLSIEPHPQVDGLAMPAIGFWQTVEGTLSAPMGSSTQFVNLGGSGPLESPAA